MAILGKQCFDEVYAQANDLANKLNPLIEGQVEEQQNFTLEFTNPDKIKLHCSIPQIYGTNYVPYHCGGDSQKHYLSKLITYLALIQRRPEVHMKFCNEKTIHELAQPKESRQALEGILELYLSGLIQPLAFFPECYQEYFAKRQAETPIEHETAMEIAASKWLGDAFSKVPPDSSKQENQICFGEDFPHDSASGAFETVFNIVESLKTQEAE